MWFEMGCPLPILKLGSRGSRLALAQVEIVRALLPEIEIEPVVIRTSGDRGDRDVRGAFVKELQQAVLDGRVDAALHCLKDIPTDAIPGLSIAAYLEREDPRDVLISRGPDLPDLPPGAVVGTGSVRRTSQIAAFRKDLEYKRLVGNVDTRLRKLQEGEYDAIVLAIAGLNRLGVIQDWTKGAYQDLTVWSLDEMVPCPGQAVLVFETRTEDAATMDLLSPLNHKETEAAVRAERAFLSAFGGGCSLPIGAYGWSEGGQLSLTGWVSTADGQRFERPSGVGLVEDPEGLGRELAAGVRDPAILDLLDARQREGV